VKVAICGAGNVGTFLAFDLVDTGHKIKVLEKNPELLKKMPQHESIEWIEADACEVSLLQKAGFQEVDVVVAATGDDEDNLVISLLSKQEFGVPRVIARVNHPENMWLFNETWGVDVSVSTPHLLSALVEEAFSVGSLVQLLQFNNGQTELVEVTLADDSPALGSTIEDLELPRDVAIVAITRDSHINSPRSSSMLLEGDSLLILLKSENRQILKEILIGEAKI
jgi:trk system potassium uptake protein TrkA